MSTKKASSRDERGDPSEKALKVTIVVCLIGLVAVYLFAFAPQPKTRTLTAAPAAPAGTAAKTKDPVAKFDRDALSTKSR